MSDMDTFRAVVRAVVEDDRRAQSASRCGRMVAACAIVTATGTVALVVIALMTFLAR